MTFKAHCEILRDDVFQSTRNCTLGVQRYHAGKKDNVCSCNQCCILMQTCKSHLIFSWIFLCLLLFSEDLCGCKFSDLLSVFLNFHIPKQLKIKLSRETFLYSLGCFCFIGITQISCCLSSFFRC